MSVKTDIVNLVITVNGNEAKKKFYDLQESAARLRTEMRELKKGTEEWIAKSKELKEVEKNIAEVRKQLDITDLSIKELRKEIMRLKSLRDALDPLSDGFKKLDGDVKKAEGRLKELNQGTGFLNKSINFLKKEILSFGAVAIAAFGLDYVFGKIGNLISKNAELSDSFSDVSKTTGLTLTEVQDLNEAFKSFNTRTPRKELLDLAVEAGKLNITGKKNIMEFVETANKIKVALGKDLGEKAVTEITKLSQIFKLQEKQGITLAESLTKVGNVINKIGQESTASESFLVDFLSRTGAVGAQADMTIQQLTALASASDQLNLSAEVTATTFNQVLPDMFTNTAAYAEVAGMSTADFARILNTDASEALLLFLKGLNGNNAGLGMMAEKLKDVQIDGTRGIAVLAGLAQNTNLIETALSQANDEFDRGNSMLQEYNLRNENFAANVEKIKKGISGWYQSSDMIKFFQEAFGWMSKLFDVPLSKKLEDERTRLYEIEIQLKNTNIKQADRLKLLKELQENYPAYFANMDIETASNLEIYEALKLVNKELINKIVIQKKQEEIDKQNEKTASALTRQIEKQKALEKEMAEIAQKYKLEIPTGASTLDQAIKLYEKTEELLDKGKGNQGRFGKGGWFDPLFDLGKMIKNFPFVESQLQTQNKIVEGLIAEKEDLMKRLGIDTTSTTGSSSTTDTPTAPGAPKGDAEKAKQDAEKLKQDLEKFNKDIEKLRQDAKRAKIDVIQEELDAELQLLELERVEKNKSINEDRDRLTDEARRLRQGKAVVEQIHSDSFARIVANNEEAEEKNKAIRLKYEEEIKQELYNNEIKNLNDSMASQRLFYSQLYASGQIDKAAFDARIVAAEQQNAQVLLGIAEKYGIDVTQVKQDIADDEIKLLEQTIERKKRLLKRQADFEVELAEYNQANGSGSADAVLQAKLNQLGVEMQAELDAVVGHEEEIFQIKKEYNLKIKQLNEDTRADQISNNADTASMYMDVFNNAASEIFNFRSSKIQDELNLIQNKISKEQADLDRQYKSRLISDVEFNNKKKIANEKLEKEERAAKRKAAINNKMAAIFDILLKTAIGIATAVSQNPMGGGLPGSAIAAGMGALQLAFVAAQPVPQYRDGGYARVKGASDGRTYDAKLLPNFQHGYINNNSLVLAGEDGKPEYFVSNTALQKPAVQYVVDGIDALTQGKIAYPDFVSMLAMPAMQQRAIGGYVGQSSTEMPKFSTGKSTGDNLGEMFSAMASTLNRLNQHLDVGIKSEAIIQDKTIFDLNERNDFLKRIENEAS